MFQANLTVNTFMVKIYKPTTPGRRQMSVIDYKSVLTTTKSKPEKRLVKGAGKKSGRAHGKISTRHKGGGHKQTYRIIDFKQDKFDIPGRVATIEYDPNRTSFIALIVYKDGEKRYIIAPDGLKANQEIITAKQAPVKIGNRMMLKSIPVGTQVYNIELTPGRGGQIARGAGSYGTITTHEGGYTHLTMPSGEVRMVSEESMGTVGMVSNSEHRLVSLGKAGRARWLGIRPTVRGSAMNPVDHRHGGGEGRQPIGLPRPVTPWGKPALGVKTRKKNKASNKFIVKRRAKKK